MIRKFTNLRSVIEEKQKKHEAEMQALLQKRKEYILTLIEKIDCLYIDDDHLIGALLFLKEHSNKNPNLKDKDTIMTDKNTTTTDESTTALLTEWKENATSFFRRKTAKAPEKRAATHKTKSHTSA